MLYLWASSLCTVKNKNKKVCEFHNIFSRIFKILQKIKNFWTQIFKILIIPKPSLGLSKVGHKIWARSVQSFWRLFDISKQTNRQTNKQTDRHPTRKVKFINRSAKNIWKSTIFFCYFILYKGKMLTDRATIRS